MENRLSPLIDPDQLRLEKDLILIDVRTGPDARERYLAEHLVGAYFVDLNDDLAEIGPDAAVGGRHPLPTVERFSQLLQRLGITPTTRVVAYDDKNGANAAARFWWMLRAAGHEHVQVLNGGYDAAIAAGVPVNSGEETLPAASDFSFDDWKLATADIDEVDRERQDADSLVIDVREKDRFDGISEPIDLIAGHIPGAVNVPFADNLDEQGFYLSPERLREKYSAVLGSRRSEDVIVHCGSGVTACHTLLAFDHAGFGIPKLYVGSWSEWSRTDRPKQLKTQS